MAMVATGSDPHLERAVRAVAELDVVDMAFAASMPSSQTFRLGYMRGHRAGSMDGLETSVGAGLGGKVLALDRPLAVADYARDPGITHQFDQAVAAEGLHAVFALPVRAGNELRGAVYGAVRRPLDLGERFLRSAVRAVRAATRVTAPPPAGVVLGSDEVAELLDILAATRPAVPDADVRDRLDRLTSRLDRPFPEITAHAALSSRELEVLGVVALGCGNAEVARRLLLSVETVKSYLKSAMAKLDSHTRSEAVHRARAAGLLP
ncbi:LuxR C-terminal-related transcriptional regulator [Actinomycetospora corticicola]|uniref:DNA-binding CsgD family transcriptional regulator n=1 Tax=Actinomycetospora corticicola TaxID=663602 RepID=A0A7Y9DSQ4_9PSEU|nr:LuxR C-terminal-related transcriptional regulator [Actinomycetospora corticicola]NYD34487.1 DNA-binding CsgD family transcriptional regulator [Actinomycetospora corticicola]